MLYIPKTDDYSKILTDEEVNDSVAITFSDEVEKYVQSNSSDNSIHYHNVEIMNIFDLEL